MRHFFVVLCWINCRLINFCAYRTLICCQVLAPGGCVLLRDYGRYDHAMLRFSAGHKLGDSFYVRQDGTRAYYFSIGKV